MIACLLAAFAAPVQLERVDLLAEDGTWLIDDAPRAGVAPRATALRGLEQLRVGFTAPRASLVFGVSLGTLSVVVRRPLLRRAPLYASAGLVSSLGLPQGAIAGVEAWLGPVRVGLGAQVRSDASWARPSWDHWRVAPGLGVGIGKRPLPY